MAGQDLERVRRQAIATGKRGYDLAHGEVGVKFES
jgi:hypothetical protein